MTEQQLQLLRWKADGWTDQRIADHMHWSLRTVKDRLHDIRIALNAANTTHAVAVAIRNGWI